jgi:hypothetical protein
MTKRVSAGGMVRLVAGALALSVVMAPAAFAKGGSDHGSEEGHDRGDRLFCPNKQVLVRIDEKTCPEKPGRPAVVRKRVCCRHGDMTNCHPFRPCPPRSQS